jgi:chromosome segregation ATPase
MALAASLAEVERRQKVLEAWKVFVKAEVERRWQGFIGTQTSVKGIERFREQLAQLDRRELELALEVEKAQKEVETRRSDLAKAKAERLARAKAREKLEQHRNIWQAEVAKEEERLEDQELEDYNRPTTDPQL